MSDRRRCSGWRVDYSQKQTLGLRAVEIEAVGINVFLMQCSKCEMSDKRLMLAKPPPCKKVRNEPEDILSVVGSDTVIEVNDTAHSPIERCQEW